MSDLGMSISAVSAAGAYVPVRAIDAVRQRFPAAEEAGNSAAEAFAQEGAVDDESGSSSFAPQQDAARGRGFSLIAGLTSFFASLFSQPEAQAAQTGAATQAAAAAAYQRNAAAPVSQGSSYEVLSPSLPRLSSGRAFDLSV